MALPLGCRHQVLHRNRAALHLGAQLRDVSEPVLDISGSSSLALQAIEHFAVEAAPAGLGTLLQPAQHVIRYVMEGDGGHGARPAGVGGLQFGSGCLNGSPLGGKSRTEPARPTASAGRPAAMTGLGPGTVPTSNYASHYDPVKSHHRAWLQAVLDLLVQHEPRALSEGSELRELWQAAVETKAPAREPAAAVLRHPNPLVGVPRFNQRDSAQLAQRDRTCFSSSCAMLLEAIKPGTLKGANGDDQYLAVVQHLGVADGEQRTIGDTNDVSAQLEALAHFGVTARLVQNADFQLIEQQINCGIPVPCGYIHRGPVDQPTGSGHWLIVYGHMPTQVVVNDPWGEPDLIHGTTLNAKGMGLRFSRLNYRFAGLRLRQALDGGADRRRCLSLCTRQGLGRGGGRHPLRRHSRTAPIRCSIFAASSQLEALLGGCSPLPVDQRRTVSVRFGWLSP